MKSYKDEDWLYKRYIVDKLSARAIGIECGVFGAIIGYYIDKFKIPKRSRSESCYLSRKNPSIKISTEFRNFIIGNILGDGGLVVDKRSLSPRSSSYAHTSKYKEFVEYISEIFLNNNVEQMGNINRYIHKKNGGICYSYWTRNYSELLDFRNYLYKDGKKIIPRDLEFNPEICLHWYIGDGSLTIPKKGKGNPYVRICTEGFSIDDVNFAVNQFNNLGIWASRQPSGNSIRFIKDGGKKFLEYIRSCPKEIETIYGYKFNMQRN